MSTTLAASPSPTIFHKPTPVAASVMQDFVYIKGQYFITQASKGTAEGRESVVITRYVVSTRRKEKMILLDSGHGIGIDAEIINGKNFIYYSWNYRTHVRIPFTPGVYSFEQAKKLKGFIQYTVQDDGEMLVKYDWQAGYMTCCHGAGDKDVFYRRKISEYRAGVDVKYNSMTLSMGGDGTLQGFASIDGIFYRLLGAGANDNVMSFTDPVVVESHSWETGTRITRRVLSSLGRDKVKGWPDGHCEPEGMSIVREKDGHGSLLIGLVVGLPRTKRRQWRVYKFTSLS